MKYVLILFWIPLLFGIELSSPISPGVSLSYCPKDCCNKDKHVSDVNCPPLNLFCYCKVRHPCSRPNPTHNQPPSITSNPPIVTLSSLNPPKPTLKPTPRPTTPSTPSSTSSSTSSSISSSPSSFPSVSNSQASVETTASSATNFVSPNSSSIETPASSNSSSTSTGSSITSDSPTNSSLTKQ